MMLNDKVNNSRLNVLHCYFIVTDVNCLKDVVLDIEPRVVKRGGSSTLRCTYDLEGAPLYTVKWYRGNFEFYRYTPSEHPSTKVFHFPGIHVDVSEKNIYQPLSII